MTIATEGRVPADTLAHRLVLIRLEMGWSQREAASSCGITYGEWQSMENSHRARGLDDKVRRIAEATGYSPVWIMWGGPLGNTSDREAAVPERENLRRIAEKRPRRESNSRPTAYNSHRRAGALVKAA